MRNKKNNLFSRILNNQKGVSAILVAIVLPVLLGFTALAIDVGYMYATKNELQNIADAAALAGAGELGQIYLGLDPKDHAGHFLTTGEKEQIYKEAVDVTNLNDSEKLNDPEKNSFINTADISIGVWDWGSQKLDPPDPGNNNSADAVQVIVKRTEDNERLLATFFARIFSIFGGSHETFESSAIATAALSGPSIMAEGVIKAPFGMSDQWFVNEESCPDNVFLKSNNDCAGWHNFKDSPNDNPKPSDMGEKMLNFIKAHDGGEEWLELHFGDYNKIDEVVVESSPETAIGDSFYFTEGVNSLITNSSSTNYIQWSEDKETVTGYSSPGKAPAPMAAIFDFFRFRDGDGDNTEWTTTVPVYAGCDPVNGYTEIIGYAEISITGVNPPSESTIDVEVDCSLKIRDGRGGGGGITFGQIKGSIPNLVQ